MHLIAENLTAQAGLPPWTSSTRPGTAARAQAVARLKRADQRPPRPVRPPQRRHAPPARHLPRRRQRIRHLRCSREDLFLVRFPVVRCSLSVVRCPRSVGSGYRSVASRHSTRSFHNGQRTNPTMCIGIALAWSELPTELIGRHGLERRVHERGGEREVRFLYRDRRPRLPVWRDGRLQIVRWGNGRGQSRFLPRTGWTWQTTIEEGYWRGLDADRPSTSPPRSAWSAASGSASDRGSAACSSPTSRGRRRLHDLRARQPLLPDHDPLQPHARADRGADLTRRKGGRASGRARYSDIRRMPLDGTDRRRRAGDGAMTGTREGTPEG